MHKNTGLSKISKLLLIFFLKHIKKSHKNSTNEVQFRFAQHERYTVATPRKEMTQKLFTKKAIPVGHSNRDCSFRKWAFGLPS